MKNKLAIFDLDGTLFDTSRVNYFSYKEALIDYNINLDYEYFSKNCNGRHYKEFLPKIIGKDDEEDLNKIHKLKKELYKDKLDEAILNFHLVNIAKEIKNEYYLAVVTTASKRNAEDILKHFDIYDIFDLILTSEDVEKVKPNPEGYNRAIEYFKVEPKNTVIFEDSDVGIIAARESGASVFVVNKF